MMPVARQWAYFDHAAVAPLPTPAVEAISRFTSQASEQGDTCWPEWANNLEKLRSGIAHWLGADSGEVVLVPNTTAGINIVAEGFHWQPGDNVVIPGGEFPSNQFPWQNQARRGVECRIVPSPAGRVDLDGIRRAIDGRTRIVAASWVGFASGYRLPLADLCQLAHQRGALFFLDAIQGMGVFPLDLQQTPIDFAAADGHKWLLGPEGAGFAYIRKQHLERLACTTMGWNSVVGRSRFTGETIDLNPSAARFEGGSMNMLGFAALLASLQIFWAVSQRHGAEAIAQRVLMLHQHARDGLLRRGATLHSDWYHSCRSGILNFSLPSEAPTALRQRLLDAGIVTSVRGRGLRISLHAYNTTEEIDRLLENVGPLL